MRLRRAGGSAVRGLLLAAACALWSSWVPAAARDAGNAVVLPPYPRPSGLLPVPLDLPDFPFHLAIDPAALSVQADGVVRYTVVLTSRSGARNVFYEGVDCLRGRFKRYAYGTPQGRFQAQTDTQWHRITDAGMQRYLYQFYSFFLCNPAVAALPRHQILQRIRYQSR